ncbi:MAG TPA: hypothetical protein VFI34_06955 [Candidatus Limnocylindrales bacterium]|nr:hypothetical protein [Candidatus Limnocylindrales bacterium]
MSTTQQPRDHRRFRLATNDNETIVEAPGIRARLSPVDGDDELDTEGHRLAANDNETTVPRLRRVDPQDDKELDALGMRRARR